MAAETQEPRDRANLRGVLVLGMARSGTSAVTRSLARAGYYVGSEDQLLEPSVHNPVGYFERRDVMLTNRRILETLGGAWYNPPPTAAQLARAAEFRPRLERLLNRIEAEAGGIPLAIKDPRIGVLGPVWLSVTADRLHPLLVLRNPLEVAQSLQSRDNLSIPLGLATWEAHMTLLLGALAGRPVTVIHHRDLVSETGSLEQVVRAATAMLRPGLAALVHPEQAAEGIDVDLWRERSDPQELRANLTGRQMELHRYLSELPTETQKLDPPQHLCVTAEETAATVRELDLSVPRFKARLDAMEGSTSWRLTRPVRWLGNLRRRHRLGGFG